MDIMWMDGWSVCVSGWESIVVNNVTEIGISLIILDWIAVHVIIIDIFYSHQHHD